MAVSSEDIDVIKFARILKKLPPHPPITDAYDFACGQTKDVWWTSQREHMVSWFMAQNGMNGTGAYSRLEPNRSAKKAYNRLNNSGSILWIAEALGEDPSIVQVAADEAMASSDYRTRCKIVRQHIPWERIYELAITNKSSRGRFMSLLFG